MHLTVILGCMYVSLRTRLVDRDIGSVFVPGNAGTGRRVEDLGLREEI